MTKNKKIILEDGSVKDETFSGNSYTDGYPRQFPTDTYRSYKKRVDEYF